MFFSKICLIFLLLCFISFACTAEEEGVPAKFYDGLQVKASKIAGYYIVKKNEMLSAIATRYGLNYVKLAQWNNISPPYDVFAGQQLKLFNPKQRNNLQSTVATQGDTLVASNLPPKQVPVKTSDNKISLEKSARFYIVQPNESLSAIASRYGYNYVTLAKWNQIPAPYDVSAGQQLQLFTPPPSESHADSVIAKKENPTLTPETASNSLKNGYYVVKKNDTLFSIAFRFGMTTRYLSALNNITSSNQVYAGQKLKISKNKQKHSVLISSKTPANISENARDNSQKTSIISINNKSMLKFYCHWPTEGKIIKNFAQTGGRGIEISGKLGQAIKAVAAGKVVAVSPGIYGHGSFIVIEHKNLYLSSYTNNRRSLVKNGQTVLQGEVIAEMGQVGHKPPFLEFEIRKNGKLVNPLQFLPKKI